MSKHNLVEYPILQIDKDNNQSIGIDVKMESNQLNDLLLSYLNPEYCNIIKCGSKKRIVHYNDGNNEYYVFLWNVTHLGNPNKNSSEDRSFKKRIQISKSMNKYKEMYDWDKIKIMGVYLYDDVNIFVDFDTKTYLPRKFNNSSAHVMLNDLYIANREGFFSKIDAKGNKITCVKGEKLQNYFYKEHFSSPFVDFDIFNKTFPFNHKIESIDAIREMYTEGSNNWRQGEWAGFYLEHLYLKSMRELNRTPMISFIHGKTKEGWDFDLYWNIEDVYGDLKASSLLVKDAPGNDFDSVYQAVEKHGKLWYVVYEHDLEKDKDSVDYEATKSRNLYIKEVTGKFKDLYSYKSKMKKSVTFKSMFIVEVNKLNFDEVLKIFKQGKQPDGTPRNKKVLINKKFKNDDKFVVYRYNG